jgi:hypothetical protein
VTTASAAGQLRIIGDGAVPHQAAALLLIEATAVPGEQPGTGTGSRTAA